MFNLQSKEMNYFKLMLVFLLFLLLAFNQELAMIYILIMISDFIWVISDQHISFPLVNSSNNIIQIVLESLVGLGIFLAISTVLTSAFTPNSITGVGMWASAQSIFNLLSTTVPLLKDSKILTFIGWGIIVPIIETSFWNGRLLEGFSTYAEGITRKRISLTSYSVPLFFVIFLISGLFTVFHITAKGLNSVPLLITFVFATISCILVIRQQELRGAIMLHIFVNSAAIASSLKWF